MINFKRFHNHQQSSRSHTQNMTTGGRPTCSIIAINRFSLLFNVDNWRMCRRRLRLETKSHGPIGRQRKHYQLIINEGYSTIFCCKNASTIILMYEISLDIYRLQGYPDNSSRAIRRRTIRRGQFVADNSSRTIRRGQHVAKHDINVTGEH